MNYFLYIVIYLLVFYMGVTVFSYLWLVADRLPKEEKITIRRTVCPDCGHEQIWKDVIPIFSRIRYQNRCRYCGKRLGLGELIFELTGGAFAVMSFFIYGIHLMSVFTFLVICDLTLIAVIDGRTGYILPQFNYILLGLGVIGIWVMPEVTVTERLIGLFVISLPMFLLMVLFNGFGFGDVKMMFASGMLLGWKGNIAAFLIGAVIGGIYAIYLLVVKKKGKKDTFSFGPFLSVGVLVSMIDYLGDALVTTYIDYVKSIMSYY